MLNQEKVRSMTKAAAYEKGPEKKNIEISSYFRADYTGLQMVKSGVAYAVSFAILVVLWGIGKAEELMLMISRPEYLESLIRNMAVWFVAGLIVYEIAVYVHYVKKYDRARKSVVGFHAHLKDIHKFYEEQEAAEDYTEINLADEEKKL